MCICFISQFRVELHTSRLTDLFLIRKIVIFGLQISNIFDDLSIFFINSNQYGNNDLEHFGLPPLQFYQTQLYVDLQLIKET